ncbi:MAG: BMP family protein [Candidatus Wallbacteria bacterium]|nr:BMP family protein [Candidatus Wallbacteria bacterium]
MARFSPSALARAALGSALLCFWLLGLAAPAEERKPFQAALLSPGPISDAGWNATAYEALKRIEKELGAKISQVETKTPSEFEESFRTFGEKGYDIVFGHGFEYQDPADHLHNEYPKTVFIVTAGVAAREPNVAPLVINIDEPAYLCGYLAGLMSKTGIAGCVGGMELPGVKQSFEGFRLGFQTAKPGGQVLTGYVGNWEDAGAAKEAAKAQIQKGAEFIFHNADAAGLGIFQAVKEAKDKSVYAFGCIKDQNAVLPDRVLASAVVDIPGAMVEAAKLVSAGKFKARPLELGVANGQATLVLNPKLKDSIPKAAREKLEQARRRIVEGKVAFKR